MRWANSLAPSAESRRAFGTGPDDCVSSWAGVRHRARRRSLACAKGEARCRVREMTAAVLECMGGITAPARSAELCSQA
jgi:hypothetical protein